MSTLQDVYNDFLQGRATRKQLYRKLFEFGLSATMAGALADYFQFLKDGAKNAQSKQNDGTDGAGGLDVDDSERQAVGQQEPR